MKPITATIAVLGLLGSTMLAPRAAAAIDGLSKFAGFSTDLSAASFGKKRSSRPQKKSDMPKKGY